MKKTFSIKKKILAGSFLVIAIGVDRDVSAHSPVGLWFPHVSIGTIGHVDHGKTSLTAAINKPSFREGAEAVGAYDLREDIREKPMRGEMAVEYEADRRYYAHVDYPGHTDYVKNMITGAVQMDGAILVVAPEDGGMLHAREHIPFARQGMSARALQVNGRMGEGRGRYKDTHKIGGFAPYR